MKILYLILGIIIISISLFLITIYLNLFTIGYTFIEFVYFIIRSGIIGLLLIFFAYIMNTYAPQKNFLYKDPITKKYGVKGHIDAKDD